MGLDDEPSDIEEILERLDRGLSDANEIATGFDGSTPLQNLSAFKDLQGYKAEMMEKIAAHYGINFANPQVAKTYSVQGTPGTPGQGEITVRVIATKFPGVFIGEYTHGKGDKDFTIRALDIEE